MPPLIRATEQGLFCEAGGFHVDPWKPVERAIVTHAHSDHAVSGCGTYLTSQTGSLVLRARLGAVAVETLAWGERRRIGDVEVSLHPAGHILGSAQIRIERVSGTPAPDEGGTWVLSGDYKTTPAGAEPDPTCEPFEPVCCDTFLTESTFGLPIYRWPAAANVADEINAWWVGNAAAGVTSLLYCYSLGKAQRILAGLDPRIGPIGVHGAVAPLNAAYAAAGIQLPETQLLSPENVRGIKGKGIVIAPPSASGNTAWVRKLAGPHGISDAFASGWMRVRGKRRWRAYDRGFVVSDHADWPGLLDAIDATGASSVGVTHGYAAPLARWIAERGKHSFVVPTRYEGESLPGAASAEDTPVPEAGG